MGKALGNEEGKGVRNEHRKETKRRLLLCMIGTLILTFEVKF
jgi:hypothetical protein